MVLLRDSWWLMLLAAAFAVVSAQTGFLGHDAGHRQISRHAGPSRLLGLLHANVLTGSQLRLVGRQAQRPPRAPERHRRRPRRPPGVLVFDAEHAANRSGAAAWLTRHQAWLFFPLLLLEALNLHVSSVRALIRPGHRQPLAGDRCCSWSTSSRTPCCWSPR